MYKLSIFPRHYANKIYFQKCPIKCLEDLEFERTKKKKTQTQQGLRTLTFLTYVRLFVGIFPITPNYSKKKGFSSLSEAFFF